MSTYYSSLRAAERAALTGISNGIIHGDDKSGLVLKATASYTLLGTEAAADIIELVDLPPGCVLLEDISSVICSADPGTALVGNIGDDGSGGNDTADDDRYAALAVLSAGGRVLFTTASIPASVATPYRSTGNNKIRFTFTTATALTAGVKLIFNLYYRIAG